MTWGGVRSHATWRNVGENSSPASKGCAGVSRYYAERVRECSRTPYSDVSPYSVCRSHALLVRFRKRVGELRSSLLSVLFEAAGMCCNGRRSDPLLRRENQQRRIEGPRTARTHDGITGAPGTRKRAHHAIFRVFCPTCRAGRVHLLAIPRTCKRFAARRAGAPAVGSSARCRCKCARSTPFIPQPSLLQLRP